MPRSASAKKEEYGSVVHFVIMGCGRVGASMAAQLDRMGHSVAVIDRNSDAFRRLPKDFNGRKVKGVGFDRDALEQAGIDEAYAFAAVSNGDNSNIVSARVARETFGVEHVVARIYDANRADVYERLGIPTVATVRRTADQMMRWILPGGSAREAEDPSGAVCLVQPDASSGWVGVSVATIEDRLGARVAWISRGSGAIVPEPGTLLQEHDRLHLAVATERIAAVQRVLSRPPVQEA
ncbi:Trk family potassium (K+) transporter, NAD+ binding protein [Actinomyces denticolens]|nr:Trk family potassium (K+) transporter, NAD+ binding protein [Actinomyces denticolens]